MSDKRTKNAFISPFPTEWQTVIFRCYGFVPAKNIARALGCDESIVHKEAQRLGLDKVPEQMIMQVQGYITVIRSLWHILPNGKIAAILGIDDSRLKEILEKDDFLGVKLGQKPECPPVTYFPPDDHVKSETEKLSRFVRNNIAGGWRPFELLSHIPGCIQTHNKIQQKKIIHGYITPCRDAFGSDSERYLPDGLLEQYRMRGINGIWIHCLLSEISPYPFSPDLSERYKERREELKRLIRRCRDHGIGLYLYFNEPRALTTGIAKHYPELTGHSDKDTVCLCLGKQAVREYLFNAFYDLLNDVREIKGIITITMSENPTHCRYRTETNCPVCSSVPPEKLAAQVNNIINSAIRKSGAKTELIANTWGWAPYMGWSFRQTEAGIKMLDGDVTVMSVSEYGKKINKGGVNSEVIDYSISNPGPGQFSEHVFSVSSKSGHRNCAKIQINNSWECSAVPYLPVFDLICEHVGNLAKIGVSDHMLTWTLGGYPSPVMELCASMSEKGSEFDLDKWYDEMFGEDSGTVHDAVRMMCRGFSEYPFSINHLYLSPATLGPANIWMKDKCDLPSSMVCFSNDDYEQWIYPYPADVYFSQYASMLAEWDEGVRILKKAKKTPLIEEMTDFAEVASIHWHADVIHTRYAIEKRAGNGIPEDLICEREDLLRRLLAFMEKYPEIGFEASNHYLYTPRTLVENLLYLKKALK